MTEVERNIMGDKTDAQIFYEQSEKYIGALKRIRERLNTVNVFSAEEEQRKQKDYALQSIHEILEDLSI